MQKKRKEDIISGFNICPTRSMPQLICCSYLMFALLETMWWVVVDTHYLKPCTKYCFRYTLCSNSPYPIYVVTKQYVPPPSPYSKWLNTHVKTYHSLQCKPKESINSRAPITWDSWIPYNTVAYDQFPH